MNIEQNNDFEQPIRIAHVIGKWVGGGVESFIMNYYRNIDKSKVQFDFIIDSDSTSVPKKEIEKLGGKIIQIPPYQKIFNYISVLKRVLKENNYKIVHSHLNSLSVFPLYCAWKAKVPIRIAHSHSTTNNKEFKKNIIKNILKPFSKIFATNYFACSEHAGRWLFGNKTFENNKVILIKNAIEVKKFKYDETVRNRIRKELNVENKLVLGHVGRFVEQKNHEFLIDLFYDIYKENDDAILLLIGNGPLESKIRNKVKKLQLDSAVKFLGIKDNVNEYMQAMDIFMFPSLYEGLGIVVIEAQASGLKSICSTDVPVEVKNTDLVEFIDLNNKSKWKESVLRTQYKRNDKSLENIKNANYDIQQESEKLLEIYIKIGE